MKLKNNYFYTIRENIKDEDSTSGNLLVRSGMIKKTSSGVYMFMPLGYRVLQNIEQIIREEMNESGAQELLMPTLIPIDVIEKSGRDKSFGSSIFRLKDRFDKKYILGPTHEELFTIAGSMKIKSYKDMPFNLYQFQTKFRDEARPRYGLIRVREFIMKDAYSFDTDLAGLNVSYKKMFEAYKRAFDRMHIDYKVVKADTGAMGGILSEEFQAVTDIGEDTLVLCDKCDYASNIEVSECKTSIVEKEKDLFDKELVNTPNAKTIEELATFLQTGRERFVKTLIYNVDGKAYACLVRGDDEVNETKVRKLLKAEDIVLAEVKMVEQVTHAIVGFAGPINLDIPIIIDNAILNMTNFIVGANKDDYHYKNVNLRDFKYDYASDIRDIKEGDYCPKCGGTIYFKKGIEIGNTFKLGTKYSEALGLNYLDQSNQLNPVVMGSYGIGIGRCMAALAEQNSDDKGLVWPVNVAPYKVGIIVINNEDEKQMTYANDLYDHLLAMGIESLLDDRDERPGVKFNDMDLTGVPIRITIGNKIGNDIIEFKLRHNDGIEDIKTCQVYDYIENVVNEG
ncbi:MAG: proline--tRNA ligase [Bacilli bacterium]|jgi:prolyl-tRNA synthetase